MASGVTVRVDIELEDVGIVGWAMWDMFADTTDYENIEIPNEFYLRFPGSTDQPSLTIKYEVRDGRPMCSSIHLDAKATGREIIPTDIEVIRRSLSDWTHAAITSVMQRVSVDAETGHTGIGMATEGEANAVYGALNKQPKRRKITKAHLRKVASLYTDHIDDKPWSAIASHFDVSEATAGRYVVQARKAGYLPETESGKKKA